MSFLAGWLSPDTRPHSVEMSEAEAREMVHWLAHGAKVGERLPPTDLMLRALAMVLLSHEESA